MTVGAQMHFDRLIACVDRWAEAVGRDDVLAQVGPSQYLARHIETVPLMSPDEFRSRVEACSAMVGHAGMGTIITALQHGKPLLVLPRLGSLEETRNDHQTATALRFQQSGRILAAFSEEELTGRLDELAQFAPTARIGAEASTELMERVRSFAFGS